MSDTAARICTIIDHSLRQVGPTVDLDKDLFEDLGADSLDVLDMIMAVEGAFAIEISDDEAAEVSTGRDLVALVEAKVAA